MNLFLETLTIGNPVVDLRGSTIIIVSSDDHYSVISLFGASRYYRSLLSVVTSQ